MSLGPCDLPALHLPLSSFVPLAQCLAPDLSPGVAAFSGLHWPTHLRPEQFRKPFHRHSLTCPHTQRPQQGCNSSWGGSGLPKRSPRNRVAKQLTQDFPACGCQNLYSDPSHLTLHPVLCPLPMLPALSGQKQTLSLNDKWPSIHHTRANLPSFLYVSHTF